MTFGRNLDKTRQTPAEESAYILRRKEIWEEINGSNCAINHTGRGRPKQFASEVAAITGGSKPDINRTLRRARELGPNINRIVGTTLDKGVEMDALIKLPEEKREEIIARAEAGEKVSARPATEKPVSALEAMARIQPPDKDRKAMQRQRFWEMWAQLDDDVRLEISAVIAAKAA